MDSHPNVNVSADYLFVQSIPMLHSISKKYKFRTIEALKDTSKRKAKAIDIEKGTKRIINMYHARGLRVTQINTDNEFACIREQIRPTNLNMVAAGEHVSNVERSIRTIKEGTRCHMRRLPYNRYT